MEPQINETTEAVISLARENARLKNRSGHADVCCTIFHVCIMSRATTASEISCTIVVLYLNGFVTCMILFAHPASKGATPPKSLAP